FAHGHFVGAEGEQVSDNGQEIEPYENQGAHQKSAREGLFRINDFAGAVRAELPAFISPKNRDHRQTEIGPEAQSWVDDAEAVGNVPVKAAGLGICAGKLRIGERAEQGEGSSCNPNQEGQANGAVNLAKNGAGRPKNAGTNDRADEKKKKIAKAKCADEFGH